MLVVSVLEVLEVLEVLVVGVPVLLPVVLLVLA